MPNTTQEHISIKEIKNDIVFLKRGGAAIILQVPAVNFGLLSDREQIGIISGFAQLINSLSFTIQIFIFSERLNIESYLKLLDESRATQTNPLLLKIMGSYRMFIQSTIKENEVLDKKFFLVVPLYAEEVGLTHVTDEFLWQKIKTILLPRREQIIRLLGRIGLRAQQLEGKKITDLFYDIYNGVAYTEPVQAPIQTESEQPQPATPQPAQTPSPLSSPPPTPPKPSAPPLKEPPIHPPTSNLQSPVFEPTRARNHPFVVEELPM